MRRPHSREAWHFQRPSGCSNALSLFLDFTAQRATLCSGKTAPEDDAYKQLNVSNDRHQAYCEAHSLVRTSNTSEVFQGHFVCNCEDFAIERLCSLFECSFSSEPCEFVCATIITFADPYMHVLVTSKASTPHDSRVTSHKDA